MFGNLREHRLRKERERLGSGEILAEDNQTKAEQGGKTSELLKKENCSNQKTGKGLQKQKLWVN